MQKHPKEERTLVVIKPDGVQRALMGEIISRYERTGLKLIGLKMLRVNEDFIERHYTLDPEWRRITGEKTIKGYLDKGLVPPLNDPHEITRILLKRLSEYMVSGPLIAMVWQGAHAVQIVRKVTGSTEPLTSPIGSIRGDFLLDSYQMTDTDERAIRNLVHASGSPKEAEDEIRHWFSDTELLPYTHHQEKILYQKKMEDVF